jgi:hypothetical protein
MRVMFWHSRAIQAAIILFEGVVETQLSIRLRLVLRSRSYSWIVERGYCKERSTPLSNHNCVVPIGLLTIRAAGSAPMHNSRRQAIAGWLFGFLTVDAVIFAAIGLAVLIPLLVK